MRKQKLENKNVNNMISPKKIVELIVAFILIGTLIPLGLNGMLSFTSTNSTIQTLVVSVVPVIGVVVLVMAFIPDN